MFVEWNATRREKFAEFPVVSLGYLTSAEFERQWRRGQRIRAQR